MISNDHKILQNISQVNLVLQCVVDALGFCRTIGCLYLSLHLNLTLWFRSTTIGESVWQARYRNIQGKMTSVVSLNPNQWLSMVLFFLMKKNILHFCFSSQSVVLSSFSNKSPNCVGHIDLPWQPASNFDASPTMMRQSKVPKTSKK